MVVAGLIGMAGGMTLGLHFRVYALIPALIAACVLAATDVVGWPAPCLDAAVACIALQIGYVATAALGNPPPRPASSGATAG